jgi:hypothetical protein
MLLMLADLSGTPQEFVGGIHEFDRSPTIGDHTCRCAKTAITSQDAIKPILELEKCHFTLRSAGTAEIGQTSPPDGLDTASACLEPSQLTRDHLQVAPLTGIQTRTWRRRDVHCHMPDVAPDGPELCRC